MLCFRKTGALSGLLIIVIVALGLARMSLAQSDTPPQNGTRARRADSVPQATPPPSKKEEDVTLNSDDVVRVETNLTNIFFTAADKQKRFISNLKKEDVRVLEDGVPQQIFTFQP